MSLQPKTLQAAIQHFSNEDVCIDTVANLRWPNSSPVCPKCQGREHYYLKTQRRWKCKSCARQFSVKVGTIFEDSPIGLDKWLAALWMLVNCKNGISSYEVGRDLGVTQKTAWFMLHRLRLALRDGSFDKLGGNRGPVEADETFVGGKVKNMHADKRIRYNKRGGAFGKTIVMGFLDREARTARAKVIPNVKRGTLQAEVLANVDKKAKLYTDNAPAYDGLRARFVHEVVDHVQTYVRGQVHTNGIENFWSLLKRTLSGTYVAVEPFHLDRYLDEQMFRFNNRTEKNDSDRFEMALAQVAGKRLTFAEVTGKAGSPEVF
jgi:transposase-like protein